MDSHYQLIIIGAGPAGLAAATLAAEYNISCALIDEQPAIGGQIYRAIESTPGERGKLLGEDYLRGKKIADDFLQSSVHYFPDTQVWSLNRQREIGLLRDNQAQIVIADQVLVANGAMERPVPFPGWTLPGVMHAGAGQILFKSAGVVPADGVVLAGSGPLLLLLAWQYLHAGVNIKALLDLTPKINYLRAMPKFPAALMAHHYLTKGLTYQLELKRAGILTWSGVSDLQAHGEGAVQSVSFLHKGQNKSIDTDLLLTHFGIIPQTWLTQVAGCNHQWDDSQQCWRPQCDSWGNSSIAGILLAGDGAAIGGARTAEYAGRIAAIQALFVLGKLNSDERSQLSVQDRKSMHKEQHIRPFLEACFRVPQEAMMASLDDDSVVCRCEEVTAGQIRSAIASGHNDSNQVKFLTRCGMGPCQGRQCANAVAYMIAAVDGKPVQEAGHYRGRPPVAPLTLGQLAALPVEESE